MKRQRYWIIMKQIGFFFGKNWNRIKAERFLKGLEIVAKVKKFGANFRIVSITYQRAFGD